MSVGNPGLAPRYSCPSSSFQVLDEIRRYLKQLSGNQNPPSDMPSHQQLLMEEWHMVALVVDRILFWLFLVVTVIVTIAIMSH